MTTSNRHRPKPQRLPTDPIVEQVAALLQRSGKTDAAIAASISTARHHTMSPATVTNVRELAVARPTNYTIDWLLWATGHRRSIQPI